MLHVIFLPIRSNYKVILNVCPSTTYFSFQIKDGGKEIHEMVLYIWGVLW